MANNIWTVDELRISVLAYIEMLQLELKGLKYNKAKFNENLRLNGINRSKSALEYRMQNISAIFENIGLPIIKGYVPAKNVGERVSREIVQIINETSVFNNIFIPTTDGSKLDKDVELIRKLNNKEQPIGIKNPEKKKQEIILFARDPKVKAFVLQRANGICELCKNKGPFQDKNGIWFLEVHHIISMALGGEDTIFNTVATCQNCHKELHYGIKAETKKEILLNYLKELYKQN